MGTKKENLFRRGVLAGAGSPALRPLSVPTGHQAQISGRRCWLWKEANSKYCQLCAAAAPHTPPPHDTSHSSAGPLRKCCCGGQSNKKATKLLLMLSARKPSKHEGSKHGGIREGRRIWPQVRGNLSISPTCARLHSSPGPGSTRSLITMSLQWHVF